MHIHEVYGHACNLFVLPMYSTLLILHAHSKASKRVNEQTEPGRTDERTNQPGRTNQRTNEPTNQPGTKRTNESVTQHSTAQPYEATAFPLPLHMKQKNSHLSERHVSVSRPLFRLPLTAYAYPSRKRRGEGGTCDCATVRKYCMTMRCLCPYTRLKCINNCA